MTTPHGSKPAFDFEALGRATADALPGATDLDRDAQRLAEAVAVPARRARVLPGVVGGVLAVAAGLVLVFLGGDGPVSPALEGDHPLAVGDAVPPVAGDGTDPAGTPLATSMTVAPLDDPMRLAFAAGGHAELAAGARARVERRASGSLARLELLEGAAALTLDPAEQPAVGAGTYEIRVIERAVFGMVWRAELEVLEVRVHDGQVRVEGGDLAGATVVLGAGDRFDSGTVESAETGGANGPTQRRGARPGPTWGAALRAGDTELALERLRGQGIEVGLSRADARSLRRLADAARASRDLEITVAALRALRTRFPRSSHAQRATFDLGRAYADLGGKHRAAALWYRTYLSESPDGSLAREAQGRLLVSLDRLADTTGLRREAERYLQRYPDGPHAGFARSRLPATSRTQRP